MNSDESQRDNAALRERLSRLSQASRRINGSLDFDTMPQEVAGGARTLTGARLVPPRDEEPARRPV